MAQIIITGEKENYVLRKLVINVECTFSDKATETYRHMITDIIASKLEVLIRERELLLCESIHIDSNDLFKIEMP